MEQQVYSGASQIKTNVYNFYGLNRTRRGTKGEFESMKNMSTLEYPCAAPRGKRRAVNIDIPINQRAAVNEIQCITAPDRTNTDEVTSLTGIAGDKFYYNGAEKGDMTEYAGCTYEIIRSANLYVINCFKNTEKANVFYYNVDTDKFNTAATYMKNLIIHCSGSTISTFRYADPSANSYYREIYYYEASNGTKTYRNSDYFDSYKWYKSNNIFENFGFRIGDEVIIEGFPTREQNCGQVWYVDASSGVLKVSGGYEGNNIIDLDNVVDETAISEYAIVRAVIKSFSVRPFYYNGSIRGYTHSVEFDLQNKNKEKITFGDMQTDKGSAIYVTGITMYNVSIKRTTHIAAHNHSLWGTSHNGNYIYATTTDGLFGVSSGDIEAGKADKITIDTPGYFTGICEYGNELVAFKDESISVIFGSEVGQYGVSNIIGTGCIDGRSIVPTQQGIIFLGYNGFYIFNGNNSSLISTRLNTKYTECIAGYDGQIYYASAKRAKDGVWELLTYDMRYSTWHIQDDKEAVGFFSFRGDFYIADKDSVYKTNDEDSKEQVEWEFTAYRTHDNTLDMKALDEVWIRAEVEEGAEFTVYTDMDNQGFTEHTTFKKPGLNIYRCQVRTLSGSYYRYKIKGKGNVVFYEIELQKSGDGRKYTEKQETTYHKPIEDKVFDGDY